MKKLIIILLFSTGLQAQNKKELLYTTNLKGLIEIDGHVFKGDTLKNKIRYEASLNGFIIIDDKAKYQYRECSHKNCEIIHLTVKNEGIALRNNYIITPN